MTRPTPAACTRLLCALVAMCAAACGSGGSSPQQSGSATYAQAGSPGPPASDKKVARLVAQAPGIKNLPKDLQPPVQNLPSDFAVSDSGQKGCNTLEPTKQPRDCIYGDKSGKRSLVLFGDSHAGMWLPALDLAGRRLGWRVILLFQPGCPAPILHYLDPVNNKPNTDCDAWKDFAVRHARQLKPDLYVVTSMFRYPKLASGAIVDDATWEGGIRRLFTALGSKNVRTVWLNDTPLQRQDPPSCLAAHEHDVPACTTPRSFAVPPEEHLLGERSAVKAEGGRFIDVTPWLCTETVCPQVIGHFGAYRNSTHITATYAAFLNGVVQRAIGLHR